jgi:hypothetical protein
MEIVKYDPSYKQTWDDFVLRSNNGTMFQLQQFLEYHPEGRFPFHNLMFFKNNELRAVLPGGLDSLKIFESPVGASYGSFVIGDINFHETLEIIDAFENYCWQNGIREVYLTAAPFIYQMEFSHNLEYALLYRGFSYQRHYISHAIRLDPATELLKGFQSTARRYIRQSLRQSDVTIETSGRYDEFFPILVENKMKHGAKPTHSLEDLKRLDELMPERLQLFLVRYQGRPIGGSLMFRANDKVSLCFYNMLLYEYQHLRPIYLAMYRALQWSVEEGFEYFDIGVSQDTRAENPMTPSLNLIYFKEKFNARGILRSTFWKKLK